MGPLSRLRVIDLSPNRVGAQVSQLFADFGADVIQIEPPGGAVIRRHAAYPFWARGKRSIVLDIHDAADRRIIRNLARHADVFIETNPPGLLDELGLGYSDLSALNPRLIYTSVTGFGRQGPYCHAPGYEGVVMAKLGGFHTFRRMSPHPAPPFVNVPFASFAASQVAIHGTLAAIIEREQSGAGQLVETSLLQGFTTLDTWAWFEHLIADRWPEAFTKTDPYDDEGRPASPLTFMLMVCLTKDGSWLQFASVAPHLFAALMKALGLDWMFTDEAWKGLPLFGDDAEKRMQLWTKMLESARSKTLAEWNEIFDADPNVFAEQFRNGPVALEHPQLIHDGFTIDLDDAERGRVRQPAAIVKAARTPAELTHSAPDPRRRPRGHPDPRRRRRPARDAGHCIGRPAARRCHDPRARHPLRRAARHDDAHRSRSAGHQGRAARRRSNPDDPSVPGVGRDEGDAGQGQHRGRPVDARRGSPSSGRSHRRPTSSCRASGPGRCASSGSTTNRSRSTTPT